MIVENRIRKEVEKWFIIEPLLFSVWIMHKLVENPHIKNIRVGNGRIEYNPGFIQTLSDKMLQEVLVAEAMRILLKHPYNRKKENAVLSYQASNITLQECLTTSLNFPKASEVFHTDSLDKQYFELYYNKLLEEQEDTIPGSVSQQISGGGAQGDPNQDENQSQEQIQENPPKSEPDADEKKNDRPPQTNDKTEEEKNLFQYTNEEKSGIENTQFWDRDEFQVVAINEQIHIAHQTNSWGSTPGRITDQILATLTPEINYKKILRNFRASIISNKRLLTRMKPSRRYGFQFMGSKYAFSTSLLFAVDVSGSMTNKILEKGFSAINRIFKYGIEQVDVIQFDTRIVGEAMTMKKAKKSIQILGRGGTDFREIIEYIDIHRQYDGLIVYTDGYAPDPPVPQNKRTRIVWLFESKKSYDTMKKMLSPLGKVAFIN